MAMARPTASSAVTEFVQALPKAPSLQVQWVRCGSPGCRCTRGHPHGPYYALFWREAGRLRKRYVRTAETAAVRAACASRREHERQVQRLMADGWQEWRDLAAQIQEVERHGQ
jgi:hypothetical protein